MYPGTHERMIWEKGMGTHEVMIWGKGMGTHEVMICGKYVVSCRQLYVGCNVQDSTHYAGNNENTVDRVKK